MCMCACKLDIKSEQKLSTVFFQTLEAKALLT